MERFFRRQARSEPPRIPAEPPAVVRGTDAPPIEEAQVFFYRHLRWWQGSPGDSDGARRRKARALAEAEAWLQDLQGRVTVAWEDVDDPREVPFEGWVRLTIPGRKVIRLGCDDSTAEGRRVTTAEAALRAWAALSGIYLPVEESAEKLELFMSRRPDPALVGSKATGEGAS